MIFMIMIFITIFIILESGQESVSATSNKVTQYNLPHRRVVSA